MIYILVAVVALAFLALLVCVVLLVHGLRADLADTRAALVKHTTRMARVLAAQLARDREEHRQHIDAAATALVVQLVPPLRGRTIPPVEIRTAPPLRPHRDDATPPAGSLRRGGAA